jgi:hypothetical protein
MMKTLLNEFIEATEKDEKLSVNEFMEANRVEKSTKEFQIIRRIHDSLMFSWLEAL